MKSTIKIVLTIYAILLVFVISGCFYKSDVEVVSTKPDIPKVEGDSMPSKEQDADNESDIVQTPSDPSEEDTTPTLAEVIDVNGLATITNETDILVLVNKQRNLPSDYIPSDLVEPNVPFSFDEKLEKRKMRKESSEALEALFAKAKEDGIEIVAQSGYRSYKTQDAIFKSNVKRKGEKEANKSSAYPGQSEHQTGLAMDITSASVNYVLEEIFGETPEGLWLAKNAAQFGFIIRYPEDKTDITGYVYEPWHVRYVGKEVAEEITEQKITLEEFFGLNKS